MGASRIITLLAVGAAVIGFFFFVVTRLSTPPLTLLYSDLELGESSEIIERLTGMGIPYQLKNEGRTIYAPQDQISSLRVTLAGEGLGGSIVGYEIFDRTDNLGTTSFVQNINRIRAVEGELARTISEINSVSSARVHIVLPERQVFRQEDRKPSASIVLKTRRGGMSPSQVKAIQHIVSSAIAGLDSSSVSIIDQNGTLLARGSSDDGSGVGSSTVEESQRAMENRLRLQIESLLENAVGAGKVRAEVAVEMNLSRITSNSETVDPESQVVIGSTIVEDTSQDIDNAGAGGGVTVGGDLPDAQAPAATAGPQITNSTSRTEETTNFEISRTNSITVTEAGEILRISVAVLVDGIHSKDANGNDIYTPRSQAQLDQFAELVQSSIGYDPNRGDTVGVVNLEFTVAEEAEALPEEFNIMGLNTDAIASLVERLFWGIAAILAFFIVVKPLMGKVIASIPEAPPPALSGPADMSALAAPSLGITPEMAAAAAAGDQVAIEQFQVAKSQAQNTPLGVESQIDVASIEGRVQDSALKKVGDIVVRHPDESAAIVRNWLYSD